MARDDKLDILEKYTDMVNRCFRCGLCRTTCPSFGESGLEYSSPRGRVQFAKAALAGELPLERVFEEKILDCLNCMRCVETCPSGVRTDRIVLAARAELVRRGKLNVVKKAAFRGILKHPALLGLSARTGRLGQRLLFEPGGAVESLAPAFAGYGDKNLPRLAGTPAVARLPEISPSRYGEAVMRIGYFIGCATNYFYPEVAEATVSVLTRNRVEVVIPRGQACCGIPVYSSGDFDTAGKLADINLAVFKGLAIDAILTDCSSCSAALKHDIGELLDKPSFDVPVYDLTEFLANEIALDDEFGDLPERITYHDPCHLSRGQGIAREPRTLLGKIPGLELIELEDTGACCGGAGTFAYTHHKLSRKIGARKVEHIKNTGAAQVATPCPSCRMQLEDVLRHAGMDVGIVHPVELLDRSYAQNDMIESEFELVEE